MQINLSPQTKKFNGYSACEKAKKPNFTGVMQAKFYTWTKDGEKLEKLIPEQNKENITGILRHFAHILAQDENKMNDKTRYIFNNFCNKVPDYGFFRRKIGASHIRSTINYDGSCFLFTGRAAELIKNAGKPFGAAKKEYNDFVNKRPFISANDSYSAKGYIRDLNNKYNVLITNLINNKSERVVEPKSSKSDGGPIEVHFFVKPYLKKVKGEIMKKFHLEAISFHKEGSNEVFRTREIGSDGSVQFNLPF